MSVLFRASVTSSPAANLAKTLAQTIVFWSLFLWIVPKAIVAFERQAGLPSFAFPASQPFAIAGFLCASVLGLWSGYTMATRGHGTPLPMDAASRLVTGGPYEWVRNPMAVAGLAQGLFVGLGLGSWLTLAYVVVGGLLWNALVRPIEERDLQARFGKEYEQYAARVRCWLP